VDFSDKEADWQVKMGVSIGAALVFGGGAFFFKFFSPTVDSNRSVLTVLIAFGPGAGGNLSAWPLFGIVPDTWTDIPAKRPFCVRDLDEATGTLASVDVGVGVSVGIWGLRIFRSATDELCNFNADLGLSGGMGAGVFGFTGQFKIIGQTHDIPPIDPTLA
jgi:hypothetical protein